MLVPIALVAVSCSESSTGPVQSNDFAAAVQPARHLTATVLFGRDDTGSKFPPPSGHDRSFHAKDNVSPQTVVIDAGGTVTFEMGSFHQVAIFTPGTTPDDIDVSQTIDLLDPSGNVIIFPNGIITDMSKRLATSAFSYAPMTYTSPAGTFDTPGRYLVICTFIPHFTQANMYAWVIVR
jgi:plastocyanin